MRSSIRSEYLLKELNVLVNAFKKKRIRSGANQTFFGMRLSFYCQGFIIFRQVWLQLTDLEEIEVLVGLRETQEPAAGTRNKNFNSQCRQLPAPLLSVSLGPTRATCSTLQENSEATTDMVALHKWTSRSLAYLYPGRHQAKPPEHSIGEAPQQGSVASFLVPRDTSSGKGFFVVWKKKIARHFRLPSVCRCISHSGYGN